MSFGGSVAAMIQSLKANKRTRTTMFEKDFEKQQTIYGKFQDHKKMSSQAFELYRKRLQLEEQNSQRKFYITFGIVMLVFLSVGIYFLFFF